MSTDTEARNEPTITGLGIFGGKGVQVVADRDYEAGQEVWKHVAHRIQVFLQHGGYLSCRLL
jgi:hypothetical protein